MYRDLKEFVARLKQEGDLQEVRVPVDPAWEVTPILREVLDKDGPALLFHKVGKWQTPLLVGTFGSLRRYALALGIAPSVPEIFARWDQAFESPIKPILVDGKNAPCKEVKLYGDQVDLYADPFPVPKWHEPDSNPYLGTLHAVITQDPETGWVNLGTYRNEIKSKNILGQMIVPYRHIGLHYEKWRRLGKPMPMAIALALDPYLSILSVTAIPAQVNEYDIAGGLKGDPIEVTRGETSDLPVPAHAQIVVEGEVPIDDFLPVEGPFGEFAGYMGDPVEKSPYVKVKAVTHQKEPIFQGTPPLAPPHEGTVMMSVGRSYAMRQHLVKAGIAGIKNVCVTSASAYFHCVVSIKKSYPGHVRDVMGHVWGHPNLFCKHCIVVDEDIDPWNAYKVEWAVGTRVMATRDIEIVRHGKSALSDPSSPRPGGVVQRGSSESDLLGIDATRPVEAYEAMGAQFPASADPSPELMERVRARWREYGFKS